MIGILLWLYFTHYQKKDSIIIAIFHKATVVIFSSYQNDGTKII